MYPKLAPNSLWVVWAEDEGLAVWVSDIGDIDDRLDGWVWLPDVTYESGCIEDMRGETIGIIDTGGEVLPMPVGSRSTP